MEASRAVINSVINCQKKYIHIEIIANKTICLFLHIIKFKLLVAHWLYKKCLEKLTTLIKEVMFHKAYTRARPADRLGPWLNKALIPAGNGNSMPRGRMNKTNRKLSSEIEYICSKVSRTKLISASRSIEMNRPTRSCNKKQRGSQKSIMDFHLKSDHWKKKMISKSEAYSISIWITWWPTGLELWRMIAKG